MSVFDALARAVETRTDVTVAVLFGSRARDAAREESDVDVAFLGDADAWELARDLQLACSLEVDVVRLDTDDIPLLAAIVRDGVLIRENRRGAYASWRSHAIATLERDLPAWRTMRDAFLGRLAGER